MKTFITFSVCTAKKATKNNVFFFQIEGKIIEKVHPIVE